MRRRWMTTMVSVVLTQALMSTGPAGAETPLIRVGDPVPRDVRELYDGGCRYLAQTQESTGEWRDQQRGPGVTGMGLMVLLASGEDPNFGAYALQIRRSIRSLLRSQNPETGYLGGSGTTHGQASMYHHGFAMLALAEAYGVVDDRMLWSEDADSVSVGPRSIAQALEHAVSLAVASAAKNTVGAWRYTPESPDADTSVSGAVMMGLLGARNAGISVPEETLTKAVQYFTASTQNNGLVSYTGQGGGSEATTSIGALVFAIMKQKGLPQYGRASEYLLRASKDGPQHAGHTSYTRYYRAQALLQVDPDAWRVWNERLIDELKAKRRPDGSFVTEGEGPMVTTCLNLLALAVNYRFLPIYER